MSHLESSLVVIVTQITVPLLAALLLSFRRPAAAACLPLVCGAVAALILTACALLPFPSWLPAPAASPSTVAAAVEPTSDLPAETAVPVSVPERPSAPGGIDLSRVLASLQVAPTPANVASTTTSNWLVYIAIGLAALGLLRFGGNWAATAIARQRSRRLSDAELLTIMQSLRVDLDCRRPIDLRDCDRIGSAATIGWRRPTILLTPAWRTWSADEVRAALAHEVAHVARRDFLWRLAARLALAIHSYHPLSHWLVRRLELRQELAADARAASTFGGRENYLRCLASLALKADADSVGMAPTFLSRPSTLLRRMAMLRVKEDAPTKSRCWWTVGIVGLLSLLTLAFHGGSPDVLAEPPAPVQAPAAARPPLDVSLMRNATDKDTVGYFAIRVDELLKLPGAEKLIMNQLGQQDFGSGLPKLPKQFPDIEQIAGRISVKVKVGEPAPNHAMMVTLTMIRFNGDIDWSADLEKVFVEGVPCKYKGETYYQVEASKALQLWTGLSQKTLRLYPSDSRTLLFLDSDDSVKQAIDGKKENKATPVWNDQWRQVADGMFAVVLPEFGKRMEGAVNAGDFNDAVSEEDKKVAKSALDSIGSKTDSVVLGIDVRDHLSLKLSLKCKAPTDAKAVAEQCEPVYRLLKAAYSEHAPPKNVPALIEAYWQTDLELMTSANIRPIDGNVVISCESTDGIKALRKAIADMADAMAIDPKPK